VVPSPSHAAQTPPVFRLVLPGEMVHQPLRPPQSGSGLPMKVVVLGIMTAIFIFLLLIVLLQNRIPPPPPPPLQATFAVVSAEATRVAEHATQTAAEQSVMTTTEAIQTATGQIQTRIAGEAGRATASPT
jgi:hypothetical protein